MQQSINWRLQEKCGVTTVNQGEQEKANKIGLTDNEESVSWIRLQEALPKGAENE